MNHGHYSLPCCAMSAKSRSTVMQHYSCPTRLLDWTLSPYVALYFAVEQSPESDGAVWFFPSSAL